MWNFGFLEHVCQRSEQVRICQRIVGVTAYFRDNATSGLDKNKVVFWIMPDDFVLVGRRAHFPGRRLFAFR